LDVGCWEGDTVSELPDTWIRSGVEMNAKAASAARERGVDVRVGRVEDIDFEDALHDVVIMLDVLEHLPDPGRVMQKISSLLDDGGIFVALTGAGDGRASKYFGADWYYCHYPDHVNFYSRESLSKLLEIVGIELRSIKKICHPTDSYRNTIRKIIGKLFGRQRKFGDGLELKAGSSVSNGRLILSRIVRFRDHYLLVGVKRSD